MCSTIIELQKSLQEILPIKRFSHTLGVRYTCASLAMRYGYDIEKAQIAGLLHDCAKYMKSAEILQKCKELYLPISELEEKQPHLLHGRLGSYYAKTIYNITDEEILHAIEIHTTGTPNMSQLDKILFIADYIEPGRKLVPGLFATREAAFINIDKAIILKIESVLEYLKDKDMCIDNMTMITYDFYK